MDWTSILQPESPVYLALTAFVGFAIDALRRLVKSHQEREDQGQFQAVVLRVVDSILSEIASELAETNEKPSIQRKLYEGADYIERNRPDLVKRLGATSKGIAERIGIELNRKLP